MLNDLRLTKNEEKILTTLWDAKRPLAVSEICEHAASINMKLNQNTVQVISKQLLDRGILKVGHITQINTVLARAFEPAFTADELTFARISQLMESSSTKQVGFIAALLENENLKKEDLDELTAIIEELKKK